MGLKLFAFRSVLRDHGLSFGPPQPVDLFLQNPSLVSLILYSHEPASLDLGETIESMVSLASTGSYCGVEHVFLLYRNSSVRKTSLRSLFVYAQHDLDCFMHSFANDRSQLISSFCHMRAYSEGKYYFPKY